ncbi:hNH endonuclease [Escherichia coli]|uniref:hNH endonuclease n=1 Tax=Escherichia coli TaxID=562 RepID=UPI00254BBC88|nr:hNH endonuclease [Escherichia coli]EIP0536485.1 hNH endonuclease [Escherichia coli]
MKLFEMEGFLRGKCIPRDLKVNETNAEYLVRKFAEADAMCAALAAENAGVKAKGRELLGEACAVYAKFNKLIDPEIGDFIDGQTLHEFQYVLDCETPATDAFLAEVRAHDLNAFIQHHSAELDAHIKNGGEQFDEKSVRIRDIIVSARLFREQIRKEAAQ